MRNKFFVGAQGDRVVIGLNVQDLSPDDALNLAAWLVVIAEVKASRPFAEVLELVKS